MSNFYKADGAAQTSNKDDWETPQALFESLNAKYHFVIDLAASKDNAKCDRYFSVADDSLSKDWSENFEGAMYLNPPYGRHIGQWIKKAYETSLKVTVPIVLLIPSRTDTSYWHDYIFGKAHIKFLRGRLKFEQNGIACQAAPFPSAIITYNDEKGAGISFD